MYLPVGNVGRGLIFAIVLIVVQELTPDPLLFRFLTMRKDTKLARIRQAMTTGDWDKALRIASRFQRLGKHTDVIKRASDAINNPAIYEQLGYNIAKLKAEGIEALKERYNKSWEEVQEQE